MNVALAASAVLCALDAKAQTLLLRFAGDRIPYPSPLTLSPLYAAVVLVNLVGCSYTCILLGMKVGKARKTYGIDYPTMCVRQHRYSSAQVTTPVTSCAAGRRAARPAVERCRIGGDPSSPALSLVSPWIAADAPATWQVRGGQEQGVARVQLRAAWTPASLGDAPVLLAALPRRRPAPPDPHSLGWRGVDRRTAALG